MEEVGGGGVRSGGGGEEDDDDLGGEEEVASSAAAAEVYCAVGKDAGKEWKTNLRWVLANFPRSQGHRLVLVHVHLGAWVPVSQLADHEVAAYRKLEEDRANKALDDLVDICTSQRVDARKVIVLGDDAARGLVQLVEDHGVAELVMGAAADRAYTRKMRAPRSKKAVTVQRKASPSCRIWFVCKGNLVCTREASEGQSRAEPSTASSSPRSSASDYSRSKSSPPRLPLLVHGDEGESFSVVHDTTLMPSLRRTPSRCDGSDNATDHSAEEEAAAAAVQRSLQDVEEEDPPTPSRHGSDDAGDMDGTTYEMLRDAIAEAGNLRQEAYEETRRRQKADRDLADASRMARDAESSWQAEARRRREAEERLARERAAMEQDRRELDAILEKIREMDSRSAELELQIAGSKRAMGELDITMSESCNVLDALRLEHRREQPVAFFFPRDPHRTEFHYRDNGTTKVRQHPGARKVKGVRTHRLLLVVKQPVACMPAVEVDGDQGLGFLLLGLSELEEATGHFDESAKIGGDGNGRGGVYRGTLRGMSVSVKIISPDVAVDEARFAREVEAMARLRHPGLVALVGACPEARAVVHELVPGGRLEDRLVSEGAPMPWHTRCGVAYRTCAALAFLHSTGTVHGDVRPSNILLEDDERCSTSKLAGLGVRSLVAAPKRAGDMALAYVDPRWLATGQEEPTPRCDVHALGVVLLRLVTGMPAFAARKAALEAVGGSRAWHDVVDAGGGGWPMERATEVALLGLRCCDGADDHPAGEMLEEARGVLEAATSAAPGRTWSSLSSSSAASDGSGGGAPSYFLCPILKEVMRDPMIAGDGFTYEAEAMKEWLGSGHDTSPMTNLKLPTDELVPNHALRAAIQEWRYTRPSSLDRFP